MILITVIFFFNIDHALILLVIVTFIISVAVIFPDHFKYRRKVCQCLKIKEKYSCSKVMVISKMAASFIYKPCFANAFWSIDVYLMRVIS
jgi:hypothetical protein